MHAIDNEFVKILACPMTKQPLRLAEGAIVDRLNAQIEDGMLLNRGGKLVKDKMGRGLIREDGLYIYPVIENIPILIENEAISVGVSGKT